MGKTQTREWNKEDQRHPNAKTFKSGPLVLIADDDSDSAQLLQTVLINFGFETHLAFDGTDALKKISDKTYDLVFLDRAMPGLTGTEVLAKVDDVRIESLRQCKRWNPLPVVTFSASEKEKFRIPKESGFYIFGHWQKPISLPQLTTLTGKVITQLGLSMPTTSPEPFESELFKKDGGVL